MIQPKESSSCIFSFCKRCSDTIDDKLVNDFSTLSTSCTVVFLFLVSVFLFNIHGFIVSLHKVSLISSDSAKDGDGDGDRDADDNEDALGFVCSGRDGKGSTKDGCKLDGDGDGDKDGDGEGDIGTNGDNGCKCNLFCSERGVTCCGEACFSDRYAFLGM